MIKYILILLLCGCSTGAINLNVSDNQLDKSNKIDSSVKAIETKTTTTSTNNSKPIAVNNSVNTNHSVNTTNINNSKNTTVNTKVKVGLK